MAGEDSIVGNDADGHVADDVVENVESETVEEVVDGEETVEEAPAPEEPVPPVVDPVEPEPVRERFVDVGADDGAA